MMYRHPGIHSDWQLTIAMNGELMIIIVISVDDDDAQWQEDVGCDYGAGDGGGDNYHDD